MHTGFRWGNLSEREYLDDLGLDGRIILDGSSGGGMWGMDWIVLAYDRYRWRAIVNAVMNFRVP